MLPRAPAPCMVIVTSGEPQPDPSRPAESASPVPNQASLIPWLRFPSGEGNPESSLDFRCPADSCSLAHPEHDGWVLCPETWVQIPALPLPSA